MGCDIHAYVEVLTPIPDEPGLIKGRLEWQNVPPPKPPLATPENLPEWVRERGEEFSKEWLGRHKFVDGTVGDYWNWRDEEDGDTPPKWDIGGRNYRLFAMLADVRNGRGFAGIDMGDRLNPIAPPRGLPRDVCKFIKQESDDWGGDGHSHSHFTLSELQAYNWDQTVANRGLVGESEFQTYLKEGMPNSWCGDVSGGGVRKISNDEMKQRLVEKEAQGGVATAEADERFYTRVQWEQTYRSMARFFIEVVMPELAKLAENPDRVRLVFWFDN